ncbi:protein kinase domain-containing protein [Bremerella sp. P1]|uniref:protein kinase domain-containing protein n=1 Tax=Bremerella sp. P1 TaxID=3026424 RepID=UPI002368D000|nr:tubulin-like doman-containing protein [Bremerella sp. P1]WDI42458.1 tubulin-like doman-containing protein [Bremerella sp. P1]
MSIETSTNVREVDGYRLVQRIGAGGYGEVWRADAPGGLSKAVKLVFGFHDEARASRELKALNRIKDLRHPFLLSLERIDVIDSQLVVVTELADCCLKDRFDECRKEGLPGIPRDELLRYMTDAAEALDYMSYVHSLQHLDVKPENLLIIGNHAKVADFGLVKSIQDVTASMMAGLTPLYASPEVFNDQPTRQSDQYSLAIVYQEMLTGTLPFPGRNLAQLTAQHLNSPPRLNTLPPRDRDILSKALAKSPTERYRNCAEMIRALIDADSIAHLPQVRSGAYEPVESSKTDTKTISCNDTESSDSKQSSGDIDPQTIRLSQDSRPRQTRSGDIWEEITPRKQSVLPPFADNRDQRELRPSVVLGIGGLGSRIIRHFVDRRLELVGTHTEQHWCRCVAIDTDTTDLVQSTGQLGAAAGTPSLSTVEMPLRRPQAYRNLSRHLTKSMSRRWLYNIPLSLKTEGMRPLGRLAFADHAGRLREQIRDALADAIDLARGNMDPRNEHFAWQEKPRIVLVMSSSGGTGSGMVWDAFALAQEVIEEFGGSVDDVSLWLIHATPNGTEQQDLARCNTYACLRELYHFQVTGEYPGDAVTKIPPQRWTEKISKQITMFETGGSEARNVPVDLHDLADLLYMNVYEGREVAQRSRDSEESSEGTGPSVSAWAFAGKALCSSGHLDLAAARYTMELLHRWHGTGHGEKEQRKLAHLNDTDPKDSSRADHYQRLLDLRSAKIFQDCEFGLESVIDMVTQVVEDEIGGRPEDYFSETVGRFANEISSSRIPPSSAEMTIHVLDSLDQLIGLSNMEAEPGKLIAVSLHSEIAPHIRQIAAHYQKKVLEQIHLILNESSFRVRGVRQLSVVVDQRLSELEEKVRAMGDRTEQEVEKVRTALFPVIHQTSKRGIDRRIGMSELRALWLNYALLRTHSVIVLATCQVFQHLRTAIMRDNMWIKNTIVSLEMAEMKARERMALDDTSLMEDPKFLEKLLVLENQIDNILNSEHGGLCNLLHEERNGVNKLIAVMMECGKDLARRNASEEGSESQFLSSLEDGPDWKQRVASSSCRLTQLGPAVSRLMFMPESVADNSTVTTSAPHLAGSSPLGTKLPKVIWMESGGNIPLRDAARLLIDNRPDYIPVADRLLTRADVHWAEL